MDFSFSIGNLCLEVYGKGETESDGFENEYQYVLILYLLSSFKQKIFKENLNIFFQ